MNGVPGEEGSAESFESITERRQQLSHLGSLLRSVLLVCALPAARAKLHDC